MGRATLAVGALLAAIAVPQAGALEDSAVYLDWQSGHFRAGLVVVGVPAIDDGEPVPPLGVGPINLQRFSFAVDPCHRRLMFDLLYRPDNATLEAPDGTTLRIPFEMQVELFDPDGAFRGATHVFASGMSYALGTVPAGGTYDTELYLLKGADVDWEFRVRGLSALETPPCVPYVTVNEVEANPPGEDAGNEWVEVYNPGPYAIDVGGWTLRALGGTPESLVVAEGTSVSAGGYLVVELGVGQFLDNSAETVALRDLLGQEWGVTPALSDTANDERTNQRVPDGSETWLFGAATRGVRN